MLEVENVEPPVDPKPLEAEATLAPKTLFVSDAGLCSVFAPEGDAAGFKADPRLLKVFVPVVEVPLKV